MFSALSTNSGKAGTTLKQNTPAMATDETIINQRKSPVYPGTEPEPKNETKPVPNIAKIIKERRRIIFLEIKI